MHAYGDVCVRSGRIRSFCHRSCCGRFSLPDPHPDPPILDADPVCSPSASLQRSFSLLSRKGSQTQTGRPAWLDPSLCSFSDPISALRVHRRPIRSAAKYRSPTCVVGVTRFPHVPRGARSPPDPPAAIALVWRLILQHLRRAPGTSSGPAMYL